MSKVEASAGGWCWRRCWGPRRGEGDGRQERATRQVAKQKCVYESKNVAENAGMGVSVSVEYVRRRAGEQPWQRVVSGARQGSNGVCMSQVWRERLRGCCPRLAWVAVQSSLG